MEQDPRLESHEEKPEVILEETDPKVQQKCPSQVRVDGVSTVQDIGCIFWVLMIHKNLGLVMWIPSLLAKVLAF